GSVRRQTPYAAGGNPEPGTPSGRFFARRTRSLCSIPGTVVMMAHVLVMYDISNDRIRGKVADTCMDYGLDRIQFSAFYGQLGRNHREELMLRISTLLGDAGGK